MAKASKNDYLKLRAEALSRTDAARKLGITMNSLRSYWLPKWDINSPEAEEVAIARYKESIVSKPKDEPKPAAPAQVAEIAAETQPPVAQQEDGPYKPVLTKAEDEAIKYLLSGWGKQELLQEHAKSPLGWKSGTPAEALNGMSVWLLAQALISGYTVELTVEERLLEVYRKGIVLQDKARQEAQTGAFRLGMQNALAIAGIEVPGITD
ncbi:hypothetical protein H6F38_04755 [Paenibacillus sp. EKM208P]|nr:hypothetical protein H6F38_04755 [Paenibacillus sp. EKM208P]